MQQSALTTGPGRTAAIARYRTADGASPDAPLVRAACRAVLDFAQAADRGRPANLDVLVAVAPGIPDPRDVATFPATADGEPRAGEDAVLVQICADTHADRLHGLRLAQRAMEAAGLEVAAETQGDRILNGQEAFGFHDGRPPEVAGRGDSMFLLYHAYTQRLDAFLHLDDGQQFHVIGRDGSKKKSVPAWNDDSPLPKDGHRAAMSSSTDILRRGFPFRENGREGLVFLGAHEDAEALLTAEDIVANADLLGGYLETTGPRALFWVPPGDVAWASLPVVEDAIAAAAPEWASLRKPDGAADGLTNYEIAVPLFRYLDRLRRDAFPDTQTGVGDDGWPEYRIDVGTGFREIADALLAHTAGVNQPELAKVFELVAAASGIVVDTADPALDAKRQAFSAAVDQAVQAFAAFQAGPDSPEVASLRALEAAGLDVSSEMYTKVGEYMTIGV